MINRINAWITTTTTYLFKEVGVMRKAMTPIVSEEAFTIIKSTSLSVIVNTSLFYVRSG